MPLYLENKFLRVTVYPEEGGRIASIRYKLSDTEFLLQAKNHGVPPMQGMAARFQDGACAGIEECLPSVGLCDDETSGGPVPDHGDFWQIPWTIQGDATPSYVCLTATGFSRPLHFEKKVWLQESALYSTCTVTNIGKDPHSFLYACHPLFAIDAGDVIVLPHEVKSLRLHSSKNDRLGHANVHIPWPHFLTNDLSRTLAAESGVAEMLYTDKLKTGRCGLYRARSRVGISLHFNPSCLPYVGLWLCYGGWPDDSSTKQYAIALEPTTSPHGSLKQALQCGDATLLGARKEAQWTIRFQLSGPYSAADEFLQYLDR